MTNKPLFSKESFSTILTETGVVPVRGQYYMILPPAPWENQTPHAAFQAAII